MWVPHMYESRVIYKCHTYMREPHTYMRIILWHIYKSSHSYEFVTHVWGMSHIYPRVMSHIHESCHTFMSHVTHVRHVTRIWWESHTYRSIIMSHIHGSSHTYESCHKYMSHVTHIWVMSHIYESCHTDHRAMPHHSKTHQNRPQIPPSRVTHIWVPAHRYISHATNIYESCHTHMSHVTQINEIPHL